MSVENITIHTAYRPKRTARVDTGIGIREPGKHTGGWVAKKERNKPKGKRK